MELDCKLLSTLRPLGDFASDEQSEFITGNISFPDLDLSDDENDFGDEEDESDFGIDDEALSSDNLEEVDRILYEQLGIQNVLRNLAKLLLKRMLLPSDILVQALSYKVQSLVKGKHSVRFKDGYGMFWASVRNMFKTRSLVVFKEHFPIPTNMSKMKKKIIETCGLDIKSLGKSGLQTQNIEIWIDRKKEEAASNGLGVSISIDGKKISATKEGQEDLAGIGGKETLSDEVTRHEKNKEDMIYFLRSSDSDRKCCFMFYDKLTEETAKIVVKLETIDKLITKNSKQLEKTPNLAKYIFVLNQQRSHGESLLKRVHHLQQEVISRVSKRRLCEDCVPGSMIQDVDIGSQQNYFSLTKKDNDLDTANLVEKYLTGEKNLLNVNWKDLNEKVPLCFSSTTWNTNLFKTIFNHSFLPESQVFQACGLSKLRPLADMKDIYEQAYSETSRFDPPKKPDCNVIATLSANFSTMSFGRNMVLRDGGIYVKDGICSTPDLVVVSEPESEEIKFAVKIFKVDVQTFKFTEEMLITALICSSVTNASRGSLLVLYSDLSCVVFDLARNDRIVDKLLGVINSYIHQPRCLSRRSKEMADEIRSIQELVMDIAKEVVTLGSYPPVTEVSESVRTTVLKNNIMKPNVKTAALPVSIKDVSVIQHDLDSFLDETKKYLATQAKELICVNISDMSGSPSKLPHTLLAATYLTGSSLKSVVRDCLSSATDLLEKNDVIVLNYAVDGESLHLSTSLPDGTPGTELALVKEISKKLKGFSKKELVHLVSENGNIVLEGEVLNTFEEEEIINLDDNVEKLVNETMMLENQASKSKASFTQEDIEYLLNTCKAKSNVDIRSRREQCLAMKIVDLRSLCVKEVLPGLKKRWLIQNYGMENIGVEFDDGSVPYIPSTVFEKSRGGCYYRTVTFDPAHLSNLLRESAAKGRLEELGLTDKSLRKLSESKDFHYLKNILSLKGGCLEFDPMNQTSSEALFSQKTESGLRMLGDESGAECCKVLREGIISSMDISGVESQERCKMVHALKTFLNDKICVLSKVKRPSSREITSELFQMLNCTLDSFIISYLNIEFFNPRRKSTATVEQFFSQITLLNDGGTKLNCSALRDILERVMITNALRRGFKRNY